MSLQCGIVGLPNVGKSTLFNAVSSAKAQSANFPFCTIEPNVGTITVPDVRMNKLADLVNPQNLVPTTIEIVDIAGLVKGASKGDGLGNQFLGNIRSTHAILHVLRCFDDDNIIHVDGSVDPVRDKEIIDAELQLKDLETLENKISRIAKVARTGGDKDAARMLEVCEAFRGHLLQGKNARSLEMDKEKRRLIHDLQLLTDKPVLYVCNVDPESVNSGNAHVDRVRELIKDEQAGLLMISAAIEAEIAELESFEDRQMFLSEMGLEQSGVEKLIHGAYDLLNYITYFTVGVKEVRAWTITKGTKAPQAAGVIHTDFEKGFIRAEVIAYNDFIELGSEAACRDTGKLRVEGKEYTVADGDCMHFRFNL
ncbi:MAG: redox-regulated ATPase YchF [Bacteroidetes bacterium]|nr:redox-regulated ATPase YchF [Bacteroidota bacterium]MDA0943215.1 redox-regulated ATPase YchF [Bacteroidota bacterium]MDA1111196.1 redox-regulated ATPase YchF [Bacteroidota bacterium]